MPIPKIEPGEEVLNVKEYGEGYDVIFHPSNSFELSDIVYAFNEGGYNNVSLDAKQLYEALKEKYEGK